MLKTIPSWESYKYKEVWKITEWRDGCIFDTEFTGVCIETTGFDNPLDPKKYVLASFSTNQTQLESITFDLVTPDELP